MAAPDVLVVGGGIMGLSAAWRLAGEGAKVTVVERQSPGSGASPCAAGMLAAQMEPEEDGPFFRLACRSRELWPEMAAALREDSGVDPELVMNGIMKVAGSEAEAARLQEIVRWQAAGGQRASWLGPEEVAEVIPGIRPISGAMFAEGDGQVNPPRVVAALVAACQRRGVELRTGTPVTGWLMDGDRVTGARTAAGDIPAGVQILAAGSWSSPLASLPVFPVKGQILPFQPSSEQEAPWLASAVPVYAPGVYLVPRRNGRVLAGATSEPEAGFDDRPTLDGILKLGAATSALIPAMGAATPQDSWAGLRPGSPDGAPMIGWAPGRRGLFLTIGHYRNGILLAPLTAKLVTDALAGRDPGFDTSPFSPERVL